MENVLQTNDPDCNWSDEDIIDAFLFFFFFFFFFLRGCVGVCGWRGIQLWLLLISEEKGNMVISIQVNLTSGTEKNEKTEPRK